MEANVAPKRRPDFLTILCILTFVGSGFGLLNSITTFNNADVQAEMTRQMLDQQKDQAMGKLKTASDRSLMEKIFTGSDQLLDTRKIKQNSLFMLMSNILTLAGGILMYRLRRTGFGLYVLGTAVAVAAPLLIYWSGGLFGQIMTLMIGFIGIIFVILYALNLKHLS